MDSDCYFHKCVISQTYNYREVRALGNYLNPGNSGFTSIKNDIYIDKSIGKQKH